MNEINALNPNPNDDTWVYTLFARLQARYGHKWASQVSANHPQMFDLAVAEWRTGLEKFSGAQLETALGKCRGDFPPSLPEFQQLALDLPSVDELLASYARTGKLTGPVGEKIRAKYNAFDFRRMSTDEARAYLRRFYTEAVDEVLAEASDAAALAPPVRLVPGST